MVFFMLSMYLIYLIYLMCLVFLVFVSPVPLPEDIVPAVLRKK